MSDLESVLSEEVLIQNALERIASDSQLERVTVWAPAFDKRAPEPHKNFGIHGVECTWILKGSKGGVTWAIFTGWHLPHVVREMHTRTQRGDVDAISLKVRYQPSGAQIDTHSLRQQHEGQEAQSGCLIVPGGICYRDSAYTAGDDLLKVLIHAGGEAVWKELERWYNELPDPEAA